MRYHYEPKAEYSVTCGEFYICDHPVYKNCTLYRNGRKGLAVIQQRYNPSEKFTWWTSIDPWLIDDLYSQPGFMRYFDKYASPPVNDIYPTVTIRQIMWALKMKPIKREPWETVFDKVPF